MLSTISTVVVVGAGIAVLVGIVVSAIRSGARLPARTSRWQPSTTDIIKVAASQAEYKAILKELSTSPQDSHLRAAAMAAGQAFHLEKMRVASPPNMREIPEPLRQMMAGTLQAMVQKEIDTATAGHAADQKTSPPPRPGPSGPSVAPISEKPLVGYSLDKGKRGPDWIASNVDPVVGLRFERIDNDPVWRGITETNVAAYQLWFQKMVLAGELHQINSASQLDTPKSTAIFNLAFDAQEKLGLNAVVLLTLAHQFIDADQMMRGLHIIDWVPQMMRRPGFAPTAEVVLRQVIEGYGLERVS